MSRPKILLLLVSISVFCVLFLNKKFERSPAEIYRDADYAAHIDVVETHEFLKTESDNWLSGVLIKHKNEYLVLTAAHMVPENGSFHFIKEITVNFKGRSARHKASVYKFNRELDCAVLKIDKPTDGNFVFKGNLPKFDPSYNLEMNDRVHSLGSPFGMKYTMGRGEVENLDDWPHHIIHSSPVAGGSSGGALINKYGEVVGINIATFTGSQFHIAVSIEVILAWLDNETK